MGEMNKGITVIGITIIVFVLSGLASVIYGSELVTHELNSIEIAANKPWSGSGTLISSLRTLQVYLPDGYSENKDRHYPVIYWIPGYCGYADGNSYKQALDEAIGDGTIPPVIAVFIDVRECITFLEQGMEDFMIYELIPFIDSEYRTIPDPTGRALMGHSIGGFSALMLPFLHPGIWSAIGGNDPSTWYFEQCCGGLESERNLKRFPPLILNELSAIVIITPTGPPDLTNATVSIEAIDLWRSAGINNITRLDMPGAHGDYLGERFVAMAEVILKAMKGAVAVRNDTLPPGRITDLAVGELEIIPDGINYARLTLEWTAPGDDGNNGLASRYDIRHSLEPIQDRAYFFIPGVPDIPKPVQGRQKQSITLELGSGIHYFAIVAYDEAYNRSPVSNVLEVDVPMNLFTDVTHLQKLGDGKDYRINGPVALATDHNNDGLADLYIVSKDIFINQGNATYEEISSDWGISDSNAKWAALGDFDNDGDRDVFTERNDTPVLYQRYSNFYNDSTEAAGLAMDNQIEWATFVDLNSDQWLDIYADVQNGPSLVYLNNKNGTFTESTKALGFDIGESAGKALFADFNGDHRTDVYIPLYMMYLQDPNGTFYTNHNAQINPLSGDSSACAGDYDNDGDLDLYICSSEANRFYRNLGTGEFEDVTQQTDTGDTGSAIGAAFFDYNNDGLLDLYVLNSNSPSVLYIQQKGGTFEAHRDSEELGITRPGSASFADFDGDGDVDIYISDKSGKPGRMYRNNSTEIYGNHWLQVHLLGTVGNSDALGARVYVTTSNGTQMREVQVQSGWCNYSLPVEFGLGSHEVADSVDIWWPSGRWQFLRGVSADQVLTIKESDEDIVPTVWGDMRRTALLQNYPNPFNPETWIPYQLSSASHVVIRIYSTNGEIVRVLDLGQREAGSYLVKSKAVYWDGKNDKGESVASGLYFYSIKTGDFTATRKMVIMR
jgi:hypothetical protein